jgi:hypothetical protein
MKINCFILLLFFYTGLKAQLLVPDSNGRSRALANAISEYKKEVGESLHIYNGAAYLRTGHGVKGAPFFEGDSLLPGSIFYDGRLYENLLLQYDIVTGEIITRNYLQNNEISLVAEKINFFVIAGHPFVRLTADSLLPAFITTGFYERLYNGNLSVFARRQKIPRMSGNAGDSETRYTVYNNYFVLLNGSFYRTDDKDGFLHLLEDKKDAIRQFMKQNKVNFKKRREAAMEQVAAFYDSIKQ